MKSEEIKERLKKMAIGDRGGSHNEQGLMCLACHAAPNTLAQLQDLMEDAGVPVESVVDAANRWMAGGRDSVVQRFYIKRGRLRIMDFHSGSHQCIDINKMADFIIPLLK